MKKAIGLGVLLATLCGGCAYDKAAEAGADYKTDNTQAMPEMTPWWRL